MELDDFEVLELLLHKYIDVSEKRGDFFLELFFGELYESQVVQELGTFEAFRLFDGKVLLSIFYDFLV